MPFLCTRYMNYLLRKGITPLLQELSLDDIWYIDKLIHKYLYVRAYKDVGEISDEHLDRLYWELLPNEWRFLPPPVRPSSEDLFFYTQAIKNWNSGERKVLILGSTPELRDIIAVCGYTQNKVYVADLSYRHLIEDATLGKHIDTEQEIWVKENWLTLPFPAGYFDIVLGDLVLQQIRPAQERIFLESMQRLLKKKGIFLTRAHFLDEECRDGNVQSVVDEVKKMPISDNEKFYATKLRLLWLSSNADNRTFNRPKVYQDYKKFIDGSLYVPRYLKRIEENLRYFRNSNRDWSPPSKNELHSMFSEYFTAQTQHTSRDHVCAEYYPIFQLSPKQCLLRV